MTSETRAISPEKQLCSMEAFTRTYRRFENNKALREAMCLSVQWQSTFMPLQPGDLFPGRMQMLPIGFYPQYKGVDAYVYVYCEEELTALARQSAPHYLPRYQKLMTYWRTRHTAQKAAKLYPPELAQYMDACNQGDNAGAAMYRIAGTYLHYDLLLDIGLPGLIRKATVMRLHAKSDEEQALAEAFVVILHSLQQVVHRYAEQATDMAKAAVRKVDKAFYQRISRGCIHILHAPPRDAYEALCLVLLYSAAAGAAEFGRLDQYLHRYYQEPEQRTPACRRALVKMLCEMFGMMQLSPQRMDQRVILGGLGTAHDPATDFIALCAMEASRRVKSTVPQLTLRMDKGMNPVLWQKALDCLSEGITFPILYNDEVNVPAVAKALNVSLKEAEAYVPLGCGEYALNHCSYSTPSGYLNVMKVLELTLNEGADMLNGYPCLPGAPATETFASFEELFEAYSTHVAHYVRLLALQEAMEYEAARQDASFLLMSLLYDDCLARGKALFDGGIRYLGGTLEVYGFVNAADSLTAIRRIVYEEKRISLPRLASALKNNFAGETSLRNALLNCPKFGNDDSVADRMAAKVHEQVCNVTRLCCPKELDYYLVVHINNQTNTILGRNTAASADGRLAGEYLANANNPMSGRDQNGMTAMLNSLLAIRPEIHAGVVQNLKLSKAALGEKRALTQQLLQVYFQQGGTQLMLNVLGRRDLEQAMRNPRQYANLIVRVGGFSARFVELDRDVQQEILARTLN